MALWTPDLIWRPVGKKMLEWEHVPERLGPQAPGWAAQENENDTRRCPEGLGRSISCSFCSVSNSLSHANLTIKWEVYIFLKKSSLVFIIVPLWFCMYMYACICIMCLYSQSWSWLYNTSQLCFHKCPTHPPSRVSRVVEAFTSQVS